MSKDLKGSFKSNSERKQRESIVFPPSPHKLRIPKVSIVLADSFGELPKSSIFPLSPKSPITSSKVSNLAMSCTLPNFRKSFGTSFTPSTNKKDTGIFSSDCKNSQMNLLFHMEKPNILIDAEVADQAFRQDYGNNNKKKFENDDIGDVRKLDEWQMVFKRKKGMGGYAQSNEIAEQYMNQTKKREGNDDQSFPNVRQDLINRIVADSDEEEPSKRILKDKLPKIFSDNKVMIGDSMDQTNQELKAGIRSLEVMQRENNKDILNDLINKKIKEYIRTIDVDGMVEEQLRVHIKKVAEGVVAQFRTLKGPTGSFIVHNSVESTVKALKGKKQDQEIFLADTTRTKKRQDEVVVDYEMMENLLMGRIDLCAQNEEVLREKIKEMNIESFCLKKEAMSYHNEIEEINKKFGALFNDAEVSDSKTSSFARNTAARRHGFSLMDAQAVIVEKKLEITGLTKKMMATKDKLQLKSQDIKLKENELDNGKTQKEYLKRQLRELYFKCLKDEVALIKEKKTPLSYAWVIRSLWKMHEEVKEYAFPSFLDSYSIKFILEYAKCQDELEEFCKANNILNLISHAEDFKVLSKNFDFNSPTQSMSNQNSTRTNAEQPNYQKVRLRDLNEMLEDMKIQIADCKRGNLKAKRQVPIGKYAYYKGLGYKWEEVDPHHVDKLSSNQLDPDELNSQVNKLFNQKISEKQKIAWDQGSEKFKAMMASRKKEMDRLFKQNLGRELDDRLKANLLKIFHFLFGKAGPETYSRFLREKSGYDLNAQGKAKKANLASTNSKPTSIPNSPKSLNSHSLQNLRFHSTFGNSFYKEEALGGSSPKSAMTTSIFSLHPIPQDFHRNQAPKSAFNDRRSPTLEPKTVWLSTPQPKRFKGFGSSAGDL